MGLPHETGVTPAGQYFSPSPEVASAPRTVRLDLPDGAVRLRTDRGVFSAERVDPGTRILLRDGPAPGPAATIVDLGCGYGPIALTLARRAPGARIIAVDVNERARALCRENATALGIANVEVLAPGDVPADLVVDELWSNPPIRIGKAALHELLVSWLGRVGVDGRAVLVVQKHLGADSLATWLGTQGWSVERLGSRQGYRLLEVRRETA